MSLNPKTDSSFADYLAAEREAQDVKHEYLAGEIFAMTGASFRHNLIVANIVRHLGNQLADRPCTVLANDMRVHVKAMDLCAYPDIVGLCGEPSFYDEWEDVLTNPALIIEVLSKSTQGYDRADKFALYRALPSLREYVLASQSRVGLDLYTREAADRWVLTPYTQLAECIRLESIGCTLGLAEVYAKVEWR